MTTDEERMILIKLEQEFKDFKKHMDQKFEEMKCHQLKCDKIFDDLYTKNSLNKSTIDRHSVYVLVGGGIASAIFGTCFFIIKWIISHGGA